MIGSAKISKKMFVEGRFLDKVYLHSDVYAACLQHALTTEKEEVMGLLIGEIDNIKRESEISACVILHRSDKQPDRVEISPEQLCEAAQYADELAKKLNKTMRVVGWYHSHPHITVWPSHVDVQTQNTYQLLDPLFVGLIFSVYQNDPGATGNHVQVTCFQAKKEGDSYERREIELEIQNTEMRKFNLESIAQLPKILSAEEAQRHEGEQEEDDEELNDLLAYVHNDAFRTLSLIHIASKVGRPLCEDLEMRLSSINLRIKELEKIKKSLNE